jgi:HEAT repeat protein
LSNPAAVRNAGEQGHANPARVHPQDAATMKLSLRILLFSTLICLAGCESGGGDPDRKPATPAATVGPAGEPATAAEDEPAAIMAIKELPESERQQAYLQELQNPAAEIRAAAAKKIKPVGAALDRLTEMLANDPSPEVRIATTWSLEVSENAELPQALDALVKCLGDTNLNVVVECIESLAYAGDETTIVHLQPLLTHQDARVRAAAFEAVRFLQ